MACTLICSHPVQSSLEHLFYLSSSPKGASRHSQRSPADHGSTFSGAKVSIPDIYYPYFGQLREGPFGIGDVYLVRPIREGICLNTLGLYFGASFILGMVVRYFPRVWISLSRQQKGDRINPLVRRFVTLIQNRFPQIALEFLDSPDQIENLTVEKEGLLARVEIR